MSQGWHKILPEQSDIIQRQSTPTKHSRPRRTQKRTVVRPLGRSFVFWFAIRWAVVFCGVLLLLLLLLLTLLLLLKGWWVGLD